MASESYDHSVALTSKKPNKPRLDHIIVLLPHADLLNPPSWLKESFTLTPGGRHADQRTENKLICFRDGSYIELIAFLNDDPALKKGHWWGGKEPGIIDWAVTSDGDARGNLERLSNRMKGSLGADGARAFSYDEPLAGGRMRADGEEVKWEVTFPGSGTDRVRRYRGELPFFCHDVSPRELRVPVDEKACTHPCGAYGVRRLAIKVPDERVNELRKAYDAVLGADGSADGSYRVHRVVAVKGAREPEMYVSAHDGQGEAARELVKQQGVVLDGLVLGAFSDSSSKLEAELGDDYFRMRIIEEKPHGDTSENGTDDPVPFVLPSTSPRS